MLLQRCTKMGRNAAVLLALLILTACASSGPARAPDSEQRREKSADVVAGEELGPVIPAATLTLFEQATASMAAGDFVDAELRFKEFLQNFPDYPGAHVNLAIIHANNQNDAATEASIDAALRLDPNHPAALNQLGMLLRRNGKFLESEAAYLKAVTVSPLE